MVSKKEWEELGEQCNHIPKEELSLIIFPKVFGAMWAKQDEDFYRVVKDCVDNPPRPKEKGLFTQLLEGSA